MTSRAILLSGMMLLGGQLWGARHASADTIIELGVHLGGDEMIYEAYDNGHKDTMKAGEFFSFDFGRLVQWPSGWETQLTFGVKSDAFYEQDSEVTWVRYPLNGMVFYRMTDVRLGFGATYHLNPTVRGAGHAGNIGEKYHNALGALLEFDIIDSEKFLWGIRFTVIEYESKDDGHVVDGNSIGFLIIAQL